VHLPVTESVVAVVAVVVVVAAADAEIAFVVVCRFDAVVLPLQAYFHLDIEEVGAASSFLAECPVSSLE